MSTKTHYTLYKGCVDLSISVLTSAAKKVIIWKVKISFDMTFFLYLPPKTVVTQTKYIAWNIQKCFKQIWKFLWCTKLKKISTNWLKYELLIWNLKWFKN